MMKIAVARVVAPVWVLLGLFAWGSRPAQAENPLVQTNFTADPAPLVHEGVLYLFTSHDEDDAPPGMGRFHMLDWKCYSTTDLVNWTDHGTVASLKTFPWAVQENDAWAPQVVERAGKFYLYAPVSVRGWPKNVIAVAVADQPLGPYKDALGKPLINKAVGYIDPTVFTDDDGQAYLYFGNPKLWYVKLNKDMISYAGQVQESTPTPAHYQEGPWFYQRQKHYYMAYASTCCPEGIGYAMSDKPTGPWEFKGYIMKPNRQSSGNHPCIVEYKGKAYVFGFNYALNNALTKEHHERRSVCVAELKYNADGTIAELPWWEKAGVQQIGSLDPYARNEAETIAWSEGIKTEPLPSGQKGMCAYPTKTGAFIKVAGVDFVAGASSFVASVWQPSGETSSNTTIELHLDRPDGPLIGTVMGTVSTAQPSGGAWQTETAAIHAATGRHDLYLVFQGVDAQAPLKLDDWRFIPSPAAPGPAK